MFWAFARRTIRKFKESAEDPKTEFLSDCSDINCELQREEWQILQLAATINLLSMISRDERYRRVHDYYRDKLLRMRGKLNRANFLGLSGDYRVNEPRMRINHFLSLID